MTCSKKINDLPRNYDFSFSYLIRKYDFPSENLPTLWSGVLDHVDGGMFPPPLPLPLWAPCQGILKILRRGVR